MKKRSCWPSRATVKRSQLGFLLPNNLKIWRECKSTALSSCYTGFSPWVHNSTIFPRPFRVRGSHVTHSCQWRVSRSDAPLQAEAVRSRYAFSIFICFGLCRLVSECQGFLEAVYWRWLCLAQKKLGSLNVCVEQSSLTTLNCDKSKQ